MRTTDHWPPVAVVGAGAVGCYFGAMLARSGVGVKLVGRASHVETITRDGLLLDGLRVHERIPIGATTSIEEGVRDAGVVLFCVKTVSTESAARENAALPCAEHHYPELSNWHRQSQPHPFGDPGARRPDSGIRGR
jgi:ketopantoate reductase